MGVIKALNPAKIIETERSNVSLDTVLDTKLFDMETAQTSARWIQELQKNILLKQMSMAYLVLYLERVALSSS